MIDLRNTWIERTREVERYIYNRHGLTCGSNGFFYFNDLRIPYLGYFEKDKQNKKQIHLVNGKFEYVEEKLTDEQKEELEQLGINKNSEGVPNDVTSDDLVGLQTRKKDCQFAKKGKENGNNVFRDNTSDSVDSSRGNQNNSEVACPFAKYGFKKPDFECGILGKVEKSIIGWRKANNNIAATKWSEKGINAYGRIYNLTPLKKEWWEVKDSFEIAVKQIKSTNDYTDKDGKVQIMEKYTDKLGNPLYRSNYCIIPTQWLKCYRPATKEEVLKLVIGE